MATSGIDQTHANNLLSGSLLGGTYTPPTGPVMAALMTANGSDTANGTELAGGSYARQSMAFGTPASGSTSNTGTVNFPGMPATTVTGAELWDSVPVRLWWGALGSSITTASGDTLTFASAAVSAAMA